MAKFSSLAGKDAFVSFEKVKMFLIFAVRKEKLNEQTKTSVSVQKDAVAGNVNVCTGNIGAFHQSKHLVGHKQ